MGWGAAAGWWSSQNTPSICWLRSPSDGHGLWCPKTITTEYWSQVTIAHIIIMFKILRDSLKCEADTGEQMPLGLLEARLPQPSACGNGVHPPEATRCACAGVLGSHSSQNLSHLLYSLLRLFLCEADCFFACFQCVCHCSSKHFCHCLVCHTVLTPDTCGSFHPV